MTKTAFISGHLDLTEEEFDLHYKSPIVRAISRGDSFVIGDARGADVIAQRLLYRMALDGVNEVTVYHMLEAPRNFAFGTGWKLSGGFTSDKERDEAMTKASDYDIAWVRPGREKSGTAKNIKRRTEVR